MFARSKSPKPSSSSHSAGHRPPATLQVSPPSSPAPFLAPPGRYHSSADNSPLTSPTLQRQPSLSRVDPFARVFPLPPGADGGDLAPPSIRPGSVRSITLERSGAGGESPDDDRASRRSVRSRKASSRSINNSSNNNNNNNSRPTAEEAVIMPSPVEYHHTLAPPQNTGKSSSSRSNMTPKPQNKRLTEVNLELAEGNDRVGALNSTLNSTTDSLGVIGSFDKRLNRSVMSLGSRTKAEKVLGVDPQPRLASLYLVSGLGKDPAQWALSDKDATLGVHPMEDSLGVFWRPDMLGNTFSGEKNEDWVSRHGKSSGHSQRSNNSGTSRREVSSKTVPGAGPEGPSRLVARTMKYAHPKDVEVINSQLAPPTTCHTFTFSVSRQSTLWAIAAQAGRKGGDQYQTAFSNYDSAGLPPAGQEHLRGTTSSSDLVFYGVTLTVWSHADKDRAAKLKEFKSRAAQRPRVSSNISDATAKGGSRRRKAPWLTAGRKGGQSDYTASETGMSDSDMDTTFTATDVDYSVTDMNQAYGESSDVFWLPYALTLVSRYPIYDVMHDYLRLSWARYSKDARSHMRQIFSLLNGDAPRPGDLFRLPIGTTVDDEVMIEATMPGALDFEKGTLKVDYQMWPLFQALDLDHIITCMEVALSNSGRIIFCSRHPAMLGVAVDTLKYIVELRGWDGIALPNIHSRDATFLIEDPGPYIIGIATECRYVVTPPPEVVIVDLDMNTLSCKGLPTGVVTPRHKREKARMKLLAALGAAYPYERSVPMEYRVSFPKGSFRNVNRVLHGPVRPRYLGERLHIPSWWNQTAVIAVFDKIMADKHKKPSLFQRLTKSGFARAQEQLTANEQIAKAMMRKRALHYVEKRDDFELKVARITRRLQKLIQEGEHWKQRFEMFEKYAERLSQEAADLKAKIDREQREARRLSNINTEQEKTNLQLQQKLAQTENARAEAMRQLSDMHHSIQELERERNEIMDVIEMQITSALEHMPYLDLERQRSGTPEMHHRSTTPVETPPMSPMSGNSYGTVRRKHRPGTRDSTQSQFTIDSGAPMSVLGALNDGPTRRGLGSILDMDSINGADRVLSVTKSDTIAQRVALIQAKLELALAPVHQLAAEADSEDSHSGSSMGTGSSSGGDHKVQGHDDEAGSITSHEDHIRKVRPDSQLLATVAVTAPSDDGKSDTSDAGRSGSDRPPPPPRSELRNPPPQPQQPPPGFRALVLRPPPRRVTQKKSYESIDSTSSTEVVKATLHPRNSLGAVGGAHEIILTSPDSTESLRSDDSKEHRKESHLRVVEERPASIISTTTIAFGGAE